MWEIFQDVVGLVRFAGGDGLLFRVNFGICCDMNSSTINSLLRLPKKKRMQIAERLWLSVADEASMAVPAAHQTVIRQRTADYRSGRAQVISHAELLRRVRSA